MPIVLDARTATDHFPGIGRYVVNLAGALRQIAPDLDIILLHSPSAQSSRLVLPDLPSLECHGSPFSIRQQWTVPAQLRRVRAELYHSPYYLMPYWPGVPTVFTCHDLIPLIYPEYFAPIQRLIYRVGHVLALRTARVTIAVSQSTRADLQRLFRIDPQQIVVVSEAADAHFSPQSPDAIAAVCQKYALPERYVLYLGSNKPHKNLVRLVQAWRISNLDSQLSNLKLVIAGHWDNRYPEAKRVVEQLDMRDQVTFVGPVSEADLPMLYSGAALFVFPSLYEGFGLPVLEAMACGAPVVCSNASSLPEIAGDAAVLADPQNVNALAEAIGRVFASQELREHLREKGLSQSARFSWVQTADAILKVYQRCQV
jgi:glycosyltransferase involved in cell wall biosynthesis